MPVINSIAAAEDEMTAWRRDFHMHPELGFEEFRTSEIVAKLLESWGIEVTRGVAGTGVVGTLRGSGPGERSIGLRADMDCLPMDEQTGLPYASQTPGKMHACGHDGHTSMLLGAAKYLAETRNFAGTVHFIFQPAEEGKGGGREMVKEGLFDRFPCDEVYGMHNWPLLPAGRIAVRSGPIMAAADQFDVEIHGKGAHGAMPHLGIDPVFIAAQVITALQGLVSRAVDPLDSAVLSVTRMEGGMAHNVIPASAKLSGTVRTYKKETQDMIERGIAAIATGIASGFGATAVANYRRGYPATVNPAKEAGIAADIAASVVGEENVIHDAPPVMGAEDFSFMLNERPGCYIWLGQSRGSDDAMVHHPKYDFNDSVLPVGASWFATMVESRLKR
ncbi:amidohydrolase [Constrictibacter sp. MBR-5]|jgi:hippurate hydrolase|uniref:M20 aminoacylase family protein n=1 Tax=Constrictibacter sp. MBR-5 TaxID=3156467 RepID=UPI0033925BC8